MPRRRNRSSVKRASAGTTLQMKPPKPRRRNRRFLRTGGERVWRSRAVVRLARVFCRRKRNIAVVFRGQEKKLVRCPRKNKSLRLSLSVFRFGGEFVRFATPSPLALLRAAAGYGARVVMTESSLATVRVAAVVIRCGEARRRRRYKQKKYAAVIFFAAAIFLLNKNFYLRNFFSDKFFFDAKNFFGVDIDSVQNFAIL